MSRRLAFGSLVAALCVASVVFAGLLLSEVSEPTTVEDVLERQDGFEERELTRLGSDADPVGYGGEPGPVTDEDDLRIRYGAVQELYWRTASYDTYTGTSWQSTLGQVEYDGLQSTDAGGQSADSRLKSPWSAADTSQRVAFTVEAWSIESVIPAPWQPVAVGDDLAESTVVSGDGSFRTTEGLAPGETFVVESVPPAWGYDDLALAETDPDAVDPVYTAVPDGLPTRLVEKTDEITADAETPYETAVLVERWLVRTKEYSPSAAAETDWLADEFVFEREDGTSEFFATAMATMLRTQDVPARYVTGFAPGTPIDDGGQAVHGTHAHAWVEVYFSEVGWVTFDPTPPERVVERGELLSDSPETLSGHGLSPAGAITLSANGTSTVESSGWEPVESPTVEFFDEHGHPIETPIPGTTVVVKVTKDGSPLVGHRVSFDGDPVDVTDEDGRLEAQIPYTDELTVLIEARDDEHEGPGDENGDVNGENGDVNGGDSDTDGEDDASNGDRTGNGDGTNDQVENGETNGGVDPVTESRLGALNPGEQTGIGGEVGFDGSTYGNTDTDVHLVVESTEPAYWRTDAYDEFTGAGWRQTGDAVGYEEPLDFGEALDAQSEVVEYEVTLEQNGTALPTVWRPEHIAEVDGLRVSPSGGIRTHGPVEAGTTYTGVSHAVSDDVETLRNADEDYPADIEQRYTQLPEDTPDRIGGLTADLTADDPTVYDAAMSVQEWLRAEKGYSLSVAATSEQVADEFIFEMDAGYCEYFATAMVAMLRSQDVPARYVVGYSTGQEVDPGVYEVRGMNAHAWVEVYFPDVGWVVFDPTPGDDRLATQRDALREDYPDAEYNPPGEGSPGEEFAPGEIRRDTDELLDVVEVEVGGYVDHVTVEDEVAVGEEPDPFSDQLRFVVIPHDEVDGGIEQYVELVSEAPEPMSGVPVTGTDRFFAPVTSIGTTTFAPATSAGATTDPGFHSRLSDANLTFDVETDVDVSVGDADRPGADLAVEATIQGVPVPDARVETRTASGEAVLTTARTDENGRATIELPHHETILVVVERGAAAGEVTHSVDPTISLSVDEGGMVPGGEVEVTVTSDGNPVSDVRVTPAVVESEGAEAVTTETDEHGTVETHEHGTVETDEHGTVETDEHGTVETDVGAMAETDVEAMAETDVEAMAETDVEAMAETDEDGAATVTLPYAETVTIVAERGDSRTTQALTFDPELAVEGPMEPGRQVQVTATTDGAPIPGLSVTLDGGEDGGGELSVESVVETDEEGTATVTLPYTETVTIVAIRENLRLERTVELGATLEVTTSGLAIPGTDVTTEVTVNGEPVPEATVLFEGQVVETDDEGHATVSIPVSPRRGGTVTATRGELSAETSTNVEYVWFAIGGLLAGTLGLAGWRVRVWRTRARDRSLLGVAVRIANSLASRVEAFGSLVRSPGGSVRRLVGKAAGGLRSRLRLHSTRRKATSDGDGWFRRGRTTTGKTDTSGHDLTATDRVWERFVGLVGARSSETPAEIADRAVEQGLPDEPVRRITNTYRAYRYGASAPGEETEQQLEDELAELERKANE